MLLEGCLMKSINYSGNVYATDSQFNCALIFQMTTSAEFILVDVELIMEKRLRSSDLTAFLVVTTIVCVVSIVDVLHACPSQNHEPSIQKKGK